MLHFIIGWMVTLIFIKIYLSKKKINIGINNDVIAVVLSFIIIGLLNFIQFVFSFLIHFFIK